MSERYPPRRKGALLAWDLIEELKSMGIAAAVSEPHRGEMQVHATQGIDKIPAEWRGYKIRVVIGDDQ